MFEMCKAQVLSPGDRFYNPRHHSETMIVIDSDYVLEFDDNEDIMKENIAYLLLSTTYPHFWVTVHGRDLEVLKEYKFHDIEEAVTQFKTSTEL